MMMIKFKFKYLQILNEYLKYLILIKKLSLEIEIYNIKIYFLYIYLINNIVKTQFLNKINILGEFGTWYIGTELSSKGDLIIQSFNLGGF